MFELPSYILVNYDPNLINNYIKTINPADVFFLQRTKDNNGRQRTHIVVDDVKNLIRQSQLATVGTKKVFVIRDAETMTPQSQNKMLKTLEDTTSSTFLFLCNTIKNFLPTMQSRCVILNGNQKNNDQELDAKIENLTKIFPRIKQLGQYQLQKTLSIIRRNTDAGCNETSVLDLLAIKSTQLDIPRI
ncbi:MAG: hypothetical protein LBH47_00715 [Christensenellaceae bacterium]|jgi:DNA polymerase III delta prime subunit|nr:hypothetical protein [Christensenellaceae bacterium]